MSDKKLNSVSSVTDAAYVYAETSNGETVKISKADLASVVAGLMGTEKMFPFMIRTGIEDDVNNAKESGIYAIGLNALNRPPGINFAKGELVLATFSNGSLFQICVRTVTNSLAYRSYYGEWTSWTTLS